MEKVAEKKRTYGRDWDDLDVTLLLLSLSLSPTSSRKLIKLKYLLKIQGGPVEFSSLRERERSDGI